MDNQLRCFRQGMSYQAIYRMMTMMRKKKKKLKKMSMMMKIDL